ncbi:CmpA/NrtA family ABC transporter substrate-binding protein [Alteromonas oceanisediminis]|uniref:CmpA/NrtA family ABC transporter substrate-binding protein n=1 Tax=Alteromonas oceanisediminis TaxID=2836180 RepID=UPI001BDB10BD|nr:CmpA/NrtA family ABC transporter substrate-binding protein [Alteromonas oceanisediminis]MBT0586026.1 ABC transporter substrate-binding protein [Alteromonas oceanisediminis]
MNSDASMPVTLGYVALTDSAPLVVAKELGFFTEHGLNVTLQAQHSWSTLRDKLHAGVLDAAHMLAPMPIASALGLAGPACDVMTPLVLSQNGNAITLSNAVYDEIAATNDFSDLHLPLSANALGAVVAQRRKQHRAKLRFASVFPYSCHYYQLVDWLASGQISLDDVELVIVPPTNMVDALHCGDIDGYCVGGPWNAKAVRAGFGVTVLTSCDIWPNSAEKVLGVLSQYHQRYPERVTKLCRALKQACCWLETIPNRFESARLLSGYDYLDAPIDVIAPSLIGSCVVKPGLSPREIPDYNLFFSEHADVNAPSLQCAQWLLAKMESTGQLSKVVASEVDLSRIYRSDIYHQIFSS